MVSGPTKPASLVATARYIKLRLKGLPQCLRELSFHVDSTHPACHRSMRQLQRWWILALPVLLVVVSGAIWIGHRSSGLESSSSSPHLVHPQQRARFAFTITTTGDLRARDFQEIQGPSSLESQVYQTKITWLIPEGTTVKTGDRVAELDRAPAETRRQNVLLDVQKAEAELTNAELDSASTLSQSREDVRTAEYALENQTLARDQSKFEAPTIQRQAQIDFEKAGRALDQAKKTLDVKTQQAVAKVSVANTALARARHALQAVEDAVAQFTIRSPSDGMVIYMREYRGRKKDVGSEYDIFDPVVATLPDLTHMQSQTYVNEVDIHRIAVGQPVTISLDADPGKRFSGRVTSVANVGEQHPGEDAKVFEVVIDIAGSDTTLRPGMTTANTIELGAVQNVVTVPIRAVVHDGNKAFVYKADGRDVIKQMIEPGPESATEVVVKRGVSASDEIYLDAPADLSRVQTATLAAQQRNSKR